jgi:light-regulated signal transduction histidine kinase (bacteriophytochrome)
VAAVLRDMKPDLDSRNIQWRIEALPEVWGDLAMLKQVWASLLSNAVKYTSRCAEARISVGKNSVGNGLEFYVQDNGAGFDMRYADKLFGVFQRLHRAEEFEGTGIGLAHVRRIVTRHGGHTWAEGKVDEGATFYFMLPCRVD